MDNGRVYYDYFNDVNYNYEKETFDLNKRCDPDNESGKLYDSLFRIFFYNEERDRVKVVGQKFKGRELFYSLFIEKENNEDRIILSADYIGPSINQAKLLAGLKDSEIKKFLSNSRTLGGHLLWPRQIGGTTINQARGGDYSPKCGYGVFDRIDWTLLLLKCFYIRRYENVGTDITKVVQDITNQTEISTRDVKRINNIVAAMERSKEWLYRFSSFADFCDFFILKGSFVNDNNEVTELTPFFPIKPDCEDYKRYIDNNLKAIDKRNEKMLYIMGRY
ncbi:hypothetical protein M2149_000945 [Lachnospiraceae bacterium PFB1-21]